MKNISGRCFRDSSFGNKSKNFIPFTSNNKTTTQQHCLQTPDCRRNKTTQRHTHTQRSQAPATRDRPPTATTSQSEPKTAEFSSISKPCAAHAVMDDWSDNCNIVGLCCEIGSRNGVVIELLSWTRLTRSFVPRLAGRIRWEWSSIWILCRFSRKPDSVLGLILPSSRQALQCPGPKLLHQTHGIS